MVLRALTEVQEESIWVVWHDSMKARWEELILRAQADIIAAVEAEDGEGKFSEDAWTRPGGGGGISRVMQVPFQPLNSPPLLCTRSKWHSLAARGFLHARALVCV